jgi:hypothetical protein
MTAGGSFGRLGLHVGQDWRTHLSTYEDQAPILSIDVGSTSVALCIEGQQVTEAAVSFARDLASQAARFAEAVEREHARQNQPGGSGSDSGGQAGNGEAA